MPIKQFYTYYDWKADPVVGDFKYCPRCATPLVLEKIGDRNRPTCPYCGYVYFMNPAPAVSILITQDDMRRQVLLGKRLGNPGQGKWALPSGYIEFDEDFLTTGVREAREETGLEVAIQSILNVMSSFVTPRYHFFSACLLARVVGGTLQAGDDLEDVRWFSLMEELPELAFQDDAAVIQTYAAGSLRELPVGYGT